MSNDLDLLAICSHCPANQPPSFLFLGVVHKLILEEGNGCPLYEIYSDLNQRETIDIDPYPHFRSFVLKNRQKIISELKVRRVQTSEVGRSAFLVMALQFANEHFLNFNTNWCLIDLGAGAGLNLLWEDYLLFINNQCENCRDEVRYGNGKAKVNLECTTYGFSPIKFVSTPKLIEKVGIEINPIDLKDHQNVLWLAALVWPDQPSRSRRLMAALNWARENPPSIQKGDAITQLEIVANSLSVELPICIFHSFLLPQLSQTKREMLEFKIAQIAKGRDLLYVKLEESNSETILTIELFRGGVPIFLKSIAKCHPHGYWLQWL